jgi:hypothetical protein
MPKTKISEFSATPANNTDIDSINIAEGCAPSGINDAIRELMAQLKDFQTGAVGDSFNGPVGATTAGTGAFTTLSASSTLAVTGVATLTAQPILSSLTASRAVFTDASKGLVSNAITGTGNVVMSASPTLTGTVAGASLSLSSLTSGRVAYATTAGLFADSANLTFDGTTLTPNALTVTNAVTLSGGTANGVTYLNGSKVLTSGSALTWSGSIFKADTGTSGAVFQIEPNAVNQLLMSNYGGAGYQPFLIAASDLRFFTGTAGGGSISEAMRLTSSSLYTASGINVGIGTSSPSCKLDVVGSTTSSTGIVTTLRLKNGGVASGDGTKILFTAGTSTDGAGIGSGGVALDSADLRFYTGGNTERIRINAGAPILCFSGGNTSATGTGIAFPATQSASSDANTLDDYEEGSWDAAFTAGTSGTITIGFGGNYNKGFYTKVGRLVTVTGDFYVASVSAPVGAVRITGLPFPCTNDLRAFAGVAIYPFGLAVGAITSIVGCINGNTSSIIISKFSTGTVSDLAGDMQSGAEFRISATYMTD